jgi:hypothetical protein
VYQAHISADTTDLSAEREIFNVRKIPLGHDLTKAFDLREASIEVVSGHALNEWKTLNSECTRALL